jgi:hypothetical protein
MKGFTQAMEKMSMETTEINSTSNGQLRTFIRHHSKVDEKSVHHWHRQTKNQQTIPVARFTCRQKAWGFNFHFPQLPVTACWVPYVRYQDHYSSGHQRCCKASVSQLQKPCTFQWIITDFCMIHMLNTSLIRNVIINSNKNLLMHLFRQE